MLEEDEAPISTPVEKAFSVEFQLASPFEPAGDQPAAIAALTAGVRDGRHTQVLMGVTGSGKTFTMANVIQQIQRPTLVLSHNKTLAAQLYSEFKEFFPQQRRPLFRQLLRLLPAGSLYPAARYLHRKRRLDQSRNRPPAPGGHQRPGQPPRCDHRGQRLLHLRLGLARGLSGDDGRAATRAADRSRRDAPQTGRLCNTSGTTSIFSGANSGCAAIASRFGLLTKNSPCGSSSGATRSSSFRSSIRSAAKRSNGRSSFSSIRASISSCPRSGSPAAIDTIKQELDERLAAASRPEQVARSAAAQRPHPVRHRDDAGGGLLPGDRELQPAAERPAARLVPRHAVQLLSRRISCSSSTSRT